MSKGNVQQRITSLFILSGQGYSDVNLLSWIESKFRAFIRGLDGWMIPVGKVIRQGEININSHADDTQLYLFFNYEEYNKLDWL